MKFNKTSLVPLAASALLAVAALPVSAAATIQITSRDPAGVGFNDPTPVAPVGGNPGTTLGEQRMNVYRYVADLWQAQLTSNVTITVSAGWEALTCTATSATLGSAGAWNIWYDFPGSVPGTWYPQALANKLAGVNLSAGIPDDGSGYGTVDIKTQFNVNLGNPNCLAGSPFYLGLDGNAGSKVNFVETLLHELGHGLGFSVLSVQTSTGFRINAEGTAYTATGLPSIWEGFMYDNTIGKTWLDMTPTERRASAINPLKLAWTGAQAVAGAATTLGNVPTIKVTTPAPGYSGFYDYGTASFGPLITTPSAFGVLAVAPLSAPATGPGCDPFDAAATAAVTGKVAIIDRGACTFAVKAKNAQNAGAIGVIIANNVAGPAPGLGGADPTIVIPTVGVSQADGVKLKAGVAAAVKYGSRSQPGAMSSSFSIDTTRRAGADATGRPLLYTPNPLVPGSSVSHWDTTASPNQLMEPNINADLTTTLVPPKDLTYPLLRDIGW